MTVLRITLTARLAAFVEEKVRSGAYPDAQAVVDAGLTRLRDDDEARIARYKALLQEGLNDLDAGRYETVTDISAWLDTLGRHPPE